MTEIAVVGLGAMGYGIARSILRAGHVTYGFDVVPEQIEKFRAEGGAPGDVADVAGRLDAISVVVLNAEQTEAVLFGEAGIVPRLKAGAVVLACATVPPDFARDMEARCGKHGVHYLDAPISGGAAKADTGQLSIMASGSEAAFSAAESVLDAIAETVFRLGDAAGAGDCISTLRPPAGGDGRPRGPSERAELQPLAHQQRNGLRQLGQDVEAVELPGRQLQEREHPAAERRHRGGLPPRRQRGGRVGRGVCEEGRRPRGGSTSRGAVRCWP